MPDIPVPPEQPSWRTDPLPAGLRWLEVPVQNPSFYIRWDEDPQPADTEPATETLIELEDWNAPTYYRRRMETLGIWAAQHGISLEAVNSDVLTARGGGRMVYKSFRVVSTADVDFAFRRVIDFGITRCLCGYESRMGQAVCPSCLARLACSICGTFSTRLQPDGSELLCSWDAAECSECSGVCSPDWGTCSSCDDSRGLESCENCGSTRSVEIYEGRPLCSICAEQLCGNCRQRNHQDYYSEDFGYVCRLCYHSAEVGEFEEGEVDDEAANVDTFTMPTIPGREIIRNCGIEIEGGGRRTALIEPFRALGLTTQREFNTYHYQSSHASRDTREWSIEHDGSVDWELVSPKLNMADPVDIEMLDSAVKALRSEVRAGTVSLDMRCGLHIHVDAMRIPVGGAYKLKGYWDYLEDVIFRLGAAKWPFHRAVLNGGEYTRNTPKSGMSDKLEFARHYERNNDRYYALSFSNYFRNFLENCLCGAVRYDTWDNCTCDLGKCTFEFRVFNTTANPTKIHGYLALCQALVAKAADGEDVTDIQSTMPPMAFNPIVFDKAAESQKRLLIDDWEPRVRWIFNELPLTDDEKKSILYCVENSELKHLGSEFAASLNPAQVRMEVNA